MQIVGEQYSGERKQMQKAWLNSMAHILQGNKDAGWSGTGTAGR